MREREGTLLLTPDSDNAAGSCFDMSLLLAVCVSGLSAGSLRSGWDTL